MSEKKYLKEGTTFVKMEKCVIKDGIVTKSDHDIIFIVDKEDHNNFFVQAHSLISEDLDHFINVELAAEEGIPEGETPH